MTRPLRCRSCGQHIRFAFTTSGKRIPLDVDPTPLGNVRLIDAIAHVVSNTIDMFDVDDDGVRYMPHHATCPHAHEWR